MSVAKPVGPHRVTTRWVLAVVVTVLAGEVAYHVWGVLQDTVAALQYRYRLDYGEGIVWQQALLMFGPQMYSPSQELPFIVFHYPPFYYILVRVLIVLHVDPLLAGRAISVSATIASAGCIIALALIGTRGRAAWPRYVLAPVIGLLFLCLDPVRTWGMWMRVDMLAVFLGLAATLVATLSRFATVGTTVALLLAVAAVFTKQTHLAAGISIFLVGMVCAARPTLIATLISGAVGLGCVAILELTTHGFLKHTVLYNINPSKWSYAGALIWSERDNMPYIVVMCVVVLAITIGLFSKQSIARLRQRDPSVTVLYLLAIHFWLAFAAAFQIVKDGASSNYFLDFMGVGCALLAVAMCDILARPVRMAILALALALTTSNIRYRHYFAERFAIWTAETDRLVQEIRDLPKPIASDDMVVVLRAGKSIVYEPAIVRVLTATGAWDPSALLKMFHDHAFAMAITTTLRADEAGPEITAVIESEYPIVERATSTLLVHLPAKPNLP